MLFFCTNCYRKSITALQQEKGKSQTCLLQLLQQIDSLSFFGEFDPLISKNYIQITRDFASTYPEDNMSAEFLYKAGLIAMTVAKESENSEEKDFYCREAFDIFDDILRIYPEFEGAKNCILNKGVIYDDILHNYDTAELYYREFIARYPTDSLARNMELYLQFLGKSPEEILAEKNN